MKELRKIFHSFLLIILFFSKVSAADFKYCVELFKKEEFISAKNCFFNINEPSLNTYRDYFINIINEIYDFPTSEISDKTAIGNYYLLRNTAVNFYKGNIEEALFFLQKINPKAIDKDDIPFYLYLKANITNDINLKITLATKYIYNRQYGYETFLKIYPKLYEEHIWQAVDTLIKKRMYKRAEFILPLLKPSDKKSYYLLYIYVKTGRYEKAKQVLKSINKKTKWYAVSLYILGYYAKNWKEKRFYFDKLQKTKNRKYIKKLALHLVKKSFHYKKNKEFLYYIYKLPDIEEKVWYRFLYRYFYISKKNAYNFLRENSKFIKNKNKLNYWLYLSSNNRNYLNNILKSGKIDFYKVIISKNIKNSFFKINPSKQNKYLDINLRLIQKLKKYKMYDFAYKEGVFIYKKNKNIKIKLYKVIPEIVIKDMPSKFRYIKPFEERSNLIYAFMKQESLFYYKAVSVSNAVGLMQFIPSTAYWVARKRNIKDFDIVQMFNPYKSIDFGKWYINYLLKLFNNNLFYAISAYNGGATNVIKAIKRFKPKNIAEFIETHPFDETRNYLKKVYTNYVIYKAIYGEN